MIVSVCSVKGGVGKTCSCVNLAGAISRRKTKPNKVLIVDFDLQGGATSHISGKYRDGYKASLLHVLDGKCDVKMGIHRYTESLHFIPSSFKFSEMVDMDFTESLKKVLRYVKGKYDFIFFDLCPSISKFSLIPLRFSDTCIIPVYMKGGLSILGLRAQAEVIVQIRKESNKKLDIIGVLPTFMGRTRVCKEVLEYLKENCEDECFETLVRENTHLSESASCGKLIFEHAPKSNGAKDYEMLCKEFLKRVKNRRKKR